MSISKKILIKAGRVVDPANNIDGINDVLIEGAKITRVAKDIKAPADKIIDASGKIVMPGLVDMHVHLRQPGREDKETITSGAKAAIYGGVTSVLAMPNTSPCIDSAASVDLLKGIIKDTANINVFICGAVTKAREGRELADIAGMVKKGIIAISDDGASCDDEGLMQKALGIAKKQDVLAICHCEDKSLNNKGVVNSGFTSMRMGLRGISKESEYKRAQRDVQLAERIGARIHIAHISCAETVDIVRKAKKKGVSVTCEVAPHHFFLTEEAVLGYDTNFKMNPPLRAMDDVAAIKQGLRDGTIDAIASDHAPHTENEKEIEFDRAEFGVIGLETELAVSIAELICEGLLDWPALVRKLALNPAGILGINKGALSVGAIADIVVISPQKEWVVKREGIVSKSKNSAFIGRRLKGAVEYTICSGKVYEIHRNG